MEWFNSVDATYRSDLRELNELNFARFDAKLEQRIAALDAKVEQRLGVLEAKLEQGLAVLEAKLIGRFESRIAEVRTEMQRWMLASRSSMMLVLLATLLAVLRTR